MVSAQAEYFPPKMERPQESGICMGDIPDWLRDFISVVEVKQLQGYIFYVNGELSLDATYIVESMYEGRKINAFQQKN